MFFGVYQCLLLRGGILSLVEVYNCVLKECGGMFLLDLKFFPLGDRGRWS